VRLAIWHLSRLDEGDPFTQKVVLAEEQPKPIDMLFIGASYIDVGIDPIVFDRGMTARGHPVTSFNLGVGALDVLEMEEALRQVIGQKNCCKYVFLSPPFHLFGVATFSDNVRSIHFMNVRHAVQEIRYVLSTPRIPNEPLTRLDYVENIIRATFRYYTNLGLGADLIGAISFSQGAHNWKAQPTWTRQGYTDVGDQLHQSDYAEVLSFVLKHRPDYLRRVATGDQQPYERAITPAMIDRIVNLGHEVEAAGAVPLLLIPPELNYWDWEEELRIKFSARCGDGHVLDYDDPAAFPELFAPSVRLDIGHLNGLGAPIWSELLADRVAKLLDSGGLSGAFCGAS
jgi:hypothetical protein